MIDFRVALLLAYLTAFVALAYEIVWYRAYSFAARGGAPAFGLMLGAYLFGIALGSRWVQRKSRGANRPGLKTLAWVLLFATVSGFLVVPAMAWAVTFTVSIAALPVLTLAAGSMGVALPLLADVAVAQDERAGARVSYLYIANIAGSTSGSLIVGFLAMDHWSLSQICLVLTALGIALVAALSSYVTPKAFRIWLPAGLAGVAAVMWLGPFAYADTFHKMIYRREHRDHPPLKTVIENRHGVIAISADDKVFGGGAYDGVFNTSLLDDRNMIIRAYVLGALVEPPREVLMVGLASGSWAQVVANMPGVEKLTIVEINPGYEELVGSYPEVKSLLDNPRVEIVYDDARRWLTRNPERKFDAIVQNTTHHFRAHITNLVSTEYFSLARAHLTERGLLHVNTTGSEEIMRTMLELFPYGSRVYTMVAAGNAPIRFSRERFDLMLRTMRVDGVPVLDLQCDPALDACKKIHARHAELVSLPEGPGWPEPKQPATEDREVLLARLRAAGVSVVTDDNMLSEWKTLKF